MPAPWNRDNSRRTAIAHRGDDRLTRLDATPVTEVVPDDIAWKVRLGATEAHAYSSGPGWMRSVCRAERWTVTLGDAEDVGDVSYCTDCALLVDGAPGEITEAYGR